LRTRSHHKRCDHLAPASRRVVGESATDRRPSCGDDAWRLGASSHGRPGQRLYRSAERTPGSLRDGQFRCNRGCRAECAHRTPRWMRRRPRPIGIDALVKPCDWDDGQPVVDRSTWERLAARADLSAIRRPASSPATWTSEQPRCVGPRVGQAGFPPDGRGGRLRDRCRSARGSCCGRRVRRRQASRSATSSMPSAMLCSAMLPNPMSSRPGCSDRSDR
jgi:hypothetical protein